MSAPGTRLATSQPASVAQARESIIDAAHANLIWTHPGMSTWYRNRHGRVVSTLPFRIVDYWAMTHSADLADYELIRAS